MLARVRIEQHERGQRRQAQQYVPARAVKPGGQQHERGQRQRGVEAAAGVREHECQQHEQQCQQGIERPCIQAQRQRRALRGQHQCLCQAGKLGRQAQRVGQKREQRARRTEQGRQRRQGKQGQQQRKARARQQHVGRADGQRQRAAQRQQQARGVEKRGQRALQHARQAGAHRAQGRGTISAHARTASLSSMSMTVSTSMSAHSMRVSSSEASGVSSLTCT